MYASPKNEKKAWGLKLPGVLHRWLDHWTRFPAIAFDALCSRNSKSDCATIMTANSLILSEFREHEAANDSWESCPVIEPSVEHSRKLKTNANPGFFLVLLDLHT